MIRRIKLLPAPSHMVEDFVSNVTNMLNGGAEYDADQALDVLVKNALRANDAAAPSSTPSANRVWDRLSGRVRGPFGKMAVEGPLLSGEAIASGHSSSAPFTLGDDASVQMPGNSQETLDQHLGKALTANDAVLTF